jgi:hypothetical protein
MSKHTKGPWLESKGLVYQSETNAGIARIIPDRGRESANGELIAAAPTLLESLTRLSTILVCRGQEFAMETNELEHLQHALDLVSRLESK